MGKYNNFIIEYRKVPVQYGRLSKRERRCRYLGDIGSLHKEPYSLDVYYRIDDVEPSGGRFFCKRIWKGDKDENIDKDGETWSLITYTTYGRLPEKIKENIKRKCD